MTENDIRENLYKYLNDYFPYLIPIEQEKHVKYDKKYCFIDILARDQNGNLVIIELKKSNAAAREAIHEVIKYTEFVKKTYAVNDDEIKLIIMSTEWEELFIPFSKFYFSNNLYDIQGIDLNVDNTGKYFSHTNIKPMPIKDERIFSPEHVYCFYKKENSLKKGLKSFIDVMKTKKIFDFVLFTLKKPKDIEYPHNYKFIIYFAMLRKTEEEYDEILLNIDPTGEASYLGRSGSHKVDSLSSFEKSLNLTHPFPHRDGPLERGRPLDFDSLIVKEGWKIQEIHTYGRLKNDILTDSMIVEEVLELTGNGNVIYNEKFYITDKRKLSKVKERVNNILSNNKLWKSQFLIILDSLNDEESEIQIELYNPTNILLSLYQEIKFIKDDSQTSLPFFNIKLLDKNIYYKGTLIWDKKKEYSLKNILEKYYSSNDFHMERSFILCTQRNHIMMNQDILEYLDLEYNSIKVTEHGIEKFHNGIFKHDSNEIQTIDNFVKLEKSFCETNVNEFEKHIISVF